jgi:hypothetical protein
MSRGALALLVSTMACSPATAFQPGEYIVRFPSARLNATRPNGQPWHTTPADTTTTALGGLFGIAVGNPEAGIAIGEALSNPGGEPRAPAPFIELRVGGEMYRVSPVGQTYAPDWRQAILVDASKRTGDEQVVVQILDAIDSAVIAQYTMTVAQFFSAPNGSLTNVEGVRSLDVAVAPFHQHRAIATYDVTVPSTLTLEALAKTGAPGWQAIPVWNGDTIEITASGSVCPSKPTPCFGPDGAEPGQWASYSYPQFRDVPHASLVAAAPGVNVPIGISKSFRVDESGWILLFVNDQDVGNNDGSFQAHVVVKPR